MQDTEPEPLIQANPARPAGRPTLCLFTDSLEPSGVGEHMLTLAAELRPAYRISLVCPPTPPGLALLGRARALNLGTLALEARGAWAEESLARWLRAERVDLFHVHAGIGWEGHHGIYAAQIAGVCNVVRTEHLPDLLTDPRQRADYQRVIGAVDRVICVSEGACSSFRRAGVPTEKLRVVRNGIDRPIRPVLRPDERRALRVRLKLPPDTQIVLSAGRLTEQKGARFLIDAVPRVIRRQPNTQFVWAGDGPLADDLQERAREREITEYLWFLGGRSDVADLMAAADLVVLPSLFEGLPLVVLEAMATGLPVVGTRVCGTTEAVCDGITGRLVESRDAAALANAVLEVLERPELAARWGAAGRRRFEREFQPARMARETAAVYEELLGRRRPSAKLV